MHRNSACWIVFFLICAPVISSGQEVLNTESAESLLIERPECVYGELAQRARIEGISKLLITVSEKGLVTDVRVISGHPLLNSGAIDCVRQSKYKPLMLNGEATPFRAIVEILFYPGYSQKDYEKDRKLIGQYIDEETKCKDLLDASEWQQAEETCIQNLSIADDLSRYRELIKMRAYKLAGIAMFGLGEHKDAQKYFKKALKFGQSNLQKDDVTLGDLEVRIGITYFNMGKPGNAIDHYEKGEKSFQQAYQESTDQGFKHRYFLRWKDAIDRQIQAAEADGKDKDVEKLKERLAGLPQNQDF